MTEAPRGADHVSVPMSVAEVFAALVQRHDDWSAAVASVGTAFAPGRELPVAAEHARLQFEEVAVQVGLLLVKALGGRSPQTRAELLDLLSGPVSSEAEAPGGTTGAGHLPLSQSDRFAAGLSNEIEAAHINAFLTAQGESLSGLHEHLGVPPTELTTADGILSLLRQIERTVAETATWDRLSLRGRRLMVEATAARIRAIQEVVRAVVGGRQAGNIQGRTIAAIYELRRQMGEDNVDRSPWGIALKHRPWIRSWLDDATEIERLLQDELENLSHGAGQPPKFHVDLAFRRLRRDVSTLPAEELRARIRELLINRVPATDKRFVHVLKSRAKDIVGERSLARVTRAVLVELASADRVMDQNLEGSTTLETDWPGFAHTAGKSALIIGGKGQQERCLALEAMFRFASLTWAEVASSSATKASEVTNNVRAGQYHIVICLLPFVPRDFVDRVFDAGLPATKIVIAQGYGVLQVKMAFERCLMPEALGAGR